jgi:hypothetical protein
MVVLWHASGHSSILHGCPWHPPCGPRTQAHCRILPVVICLSQTLSHACLYRSLFTLKLRKAYYISRHLFDGTFCSDNRSISVARTCTHPDGAPAAPRTLSTRWPSHLTHGSCKSWQPPVNQIALSPDLCINVEHSIAFHIATGVTSSSLHAVHCCRFVERGKIAAFLDPCGKRNLS